MKLHVVSDLHAGFGAFDPPETDADVLVLAGDVDVGVRGIELAKAWARGRPVLYVAGNHEFYGEAIPRHLRRLEEAAEGSPVRFLEDREVVLGGVRFLGCTLWTDFELFGARAVGAAAAQGVMNDFRKIRVEPEFRRLTPNDVMAIHHRSVRWLGERLDTPFAGPTVVVTHAAPSLRSVSPVHRRDPVTAAFASDLEWMMDGRAVLWIHGHTHFCCDYEVGGTRVVANQRGYPGEDTGAFDPACVVEVGAGLSEPAPPPPLHLGAAAGAGGPVVGTPARRVAGAGAAVAAGRVHAGAVDGAHPPLGTRARVGPDPVTDHRPLSSRPSLSDVEALHRQLVEAQVQLLHASSRSRGVGRWQEPAMGDLAGAHSPATSAWERTPELRHSLGWCPRCRFPIDRAFVSRQN